MWKAVQSETALWGNIWGNLYGESYPLANLIAHFVEYNPTTESYISRVGRQSGTVFKLQHLVGTFSLIGSWLTPASTGTKSGTASWDRTTPSEWLIGAGTFWDWTIEYEDGPISTYHYGTIIGPKIYCFDTSGHGRVLEVTGWSGLITDCSAESMTIGSSVLNDRGYGTSDGTYCFNVDEEAETGTYIEEGVIVPNLVDLSGCAALLSDVPLNVGGYWQRVDGSNILRTDESPIEVF